MWQRAELYLRLRCASTSRDSNANSWTEAAARAAFSVGSGLASYQPSKHALSPGRCESGGGLDQSVSHRTPPLRDHFRGSGSAFITYELSACIFHLNRSPLTSNWAEATRISCYHLKFIFLKLHATSFCREELSLPASCPVVSTVTSWWSSTHQSHFDSFPTSHGHHVLLDLPWKCPLLKPFLLNHSPGILPPRQPPESLWTGSPNPVMMFFV